VDSMSSSGQDDEERAGRRIFCDDDEQSKTNSFAMRILYLLERLRGGILSYNVWVLKTKRRDVATTDSVI